MKWAFSTLTLLLALQAPAYGSPSSEFVLQDVIDRFRDGYQTLLKRNPQMDPGGPSLPVAHESTGQRSRYTGPGIVKTKYFTVHEYVTNGLLMHIKVVPRTTNRSLVASLAGNDTGIRINDRRGSGFTRPYYMAPADGSPHYSDIQHAETLYPKWVITEF